MRSLCVYISPCMCMSWAHFSAQEINENNSNKAFALPSVKTGFFSFGKRVLWENLLRHTLHMSGHCFHVDIKFGRPDFVASNPKKKKSVGRWKRPKFLAWEINFLGGRYNPKITYVSLKKRAKREKPKIKGYSDFNLNFLPQKSQEQYEQPRYTVVILTQVASAFIIVVWGYLALY